MYREIQQLTGGNRGVQGVTGADSGRQGMCTGADRDCRVCRECVQGLTGGAQGMAGKHWGGGGQGKTLYFNTERVCRASSLICYMYLFIIN